MDQSLRKEIGEFWSWFAAHCDEVAQAESDAAPILDDLLARMHRIHPAFYFEMCVNSAPCELILTVEGQRELFPLADAVVAAAPQIDGWIFVSLKPAMGLAFSTDYGGAHFDPKELWFLPLEKASAPSALGIRIGVPHYDVACQAAVPSAVRVILDSSLGERIAATEIDYVETAALPDNPESKGYIQFAELPAYIEWRKKAKGGA